MEEEEEDGGWGKERFMCVWLGMQCGGWGYGVGMQRETAGPIIDGALLG